MQQETKFLRIFWRKPKFLKNPGGTLAGVARRLCEVILAEVLEGILKGTIGGAFTEISGETPEEILEEIS